MAQVRVKLNRGEVRSQLLRGGGAPGMCMGIAQSMAKQCGEGYAVRTVSTNRIGAVVYSATAAARADNFANNTIEKARGMSYD